MSGSQHDAAGPRLRPPGRRAARWRRPDGRRMGMPAEKSMNFGPSARSGCSARCAPSGRSLIVVLVLGVVSVALVGDRPEAPRPRHRTSSSRASSRRSCRRASRKQQVDRPAARAGQRRSRPTCSRRWTSCPGEGIDFDALGDDPRARARALRRSRACFGWLQGYILNGVVQRTMHRLRERGRGQAQPAAAVVLRQAAARRAAQPRHQRHRQHRADAAADAEPARSPRC